MSTETRSVAIRFVALSISALFLLPTVLGTGHERSVTIDGTTITVRGPDTPDGRNGVQRVVNELQNLANNCRGFRNDVSTMGNFTVDVLVDDPGVVVGEEDGNSVRVDVGDVDELSGELQGGTQSDRDNVSRGVLPEVLAHEIKGLSERRAGRDHDHDRTLIPHENDCLSALNFTHRRVLDGQCGPNNIVEWDNGVRLPSGSVPKFQDNQFVGGCSQIHPFFGRTHSLPGVPHLRSEPGTVLPRVDPDNRLFSRVSIELSIPPGIKVTLCTDLNDDGLYCGGGDEESSFCSTGFDVVEASMTSGENPYLVLLSSDLKGRGVLACSSPDPIEGEVVIRIPVGSTGGEGVVGGDGEVGVL